MELPAPLRAALDAALDGVPAAEIAAALNVLSRRYRAEVLDGRLHLDTGIAALAYCAARLPATFAAVRASFALAAGHMPGFSPKSLLDCGAGPGTVLWAAADCWPELQRATLLEASPAIRRLGQRLGQPDAVPAVSWRAADLTKGLGAEDGADLVTLSYLLDELEPAARERLADEAWAATAGVLVAVEPGTPAGWRRILALRERLLAQGAHLAAPCPHRAPCPVQAPDWCHFSRRVARSRSHRLAKQGSVPWEDEKFIFLAASRTPAAAPAAARVVGPPQASGGKVLLKLCQADATLQNRLFTRREGAVFRQARRAGWGDAPVLE